MTTTITTEIRSVDAEPMLDSQAMALIFGVSVDDVLEVVYR